MSHKSTNRKQSDDQKVGSSADAARNFGGKQDFGAPESDRIEREYASRADRNQDPGAPPPHSSGQGTRVAGVGANDSGPGSGSGGDLDPDIIGVGAGGAGVAASGQIHEPPGPDEAQQVPERDPNRIVTRGNPKPIEGTTVNRSGGDVSTTGAGQSGAAITNPNDPDNDAFAGEISLDEAAGMDNSPSDRQPSEQ